jgi:cytochrome c oxidase cbb3-type subunit III
MADFVDEFWSVYITISTVVGIIACAALLWSMSTRRPVGDDATTGHVWDETLTEYNNPLPRWWMWLFYITIVFGLAYLVLYPGLGTYAGTLGWTQQKAYEEELASAEREYGPLFNRYLSSPLEVVATDPKARLLGERLFLNYCATCHGSDARGSRGFPNLTDSDWLWGGTPEAIKTSIAQGRTGVMPPLASAVGSSQDVRNLANHVLSLSGSPHDSLRAQLGREKFTLCAACHGADGKGNAQLGAPNLTDRIWLHGSGIDAIVAVIQNGRNNVMPAHRDFLGDAKVHLLAAYVWGLSNDRGVASAK